MIELAKVSDIDRIMIILKDVIAEMKTYNNTQWDDTYPNYDTFKKDVENKTLYVYKDNDIIKGFVCLDFIEPKEYEDINWRKKDKALVLHRLAIAAEARNEGIAKKIMNFSKEVAVKNGVNYMKTDTYSINTKMNSLFRKVGYEKVGEMNFLGREFIFYCYDLIIE